MKAWATQFQANGAILLFLIPVCKSYIQCILGDLSRLPGLCLNHPPRLIWNLQISFCKLTLIIKTCPCLSGTSFQIMCSGGRPVVYESAFLAVTEKDIEDDT